MDVTCVKGERILLTDSCSQTYAGVVKSINIDLGRILLTDLVQLPGNKSITGYRNFDRSEIIEIRKYGIYDTAVQTDGMGDTPLDAKEQKQPEVNLVTQKLAEAEYDEIKKAQKEHRFIKCLDSNFHEAISSLRGCSIVGVHAKDVSTARFGRISVLAISSSSDVFVFDMNALGDDGADEGLREILESQNIAKVVHDCRLLSDCLKHRHLINLENIRDVEAEDIMVVFQERRTIRKHSRSLHYLINVYLGVELEENFEKGEVWNERPLPPTLLENLVAFVSFLIPLQNAIERKYTQLLYDASSIYNKHLRESDFIGIFYDDPNKTLRKEISKLLVPKTQVRREYKKSGRNVPSLL